jgi:hypothetical protein
MRLVTDYQLSGWVKLFLKGLAEVNKYSCYSPSSLLVVKLISVERMDSAILFLLFAVFSGFNCLLSALISSKSKQEGQRLLSWFSFGFKASLVLFLLFKFGNCSEIRLVVVVFVTIVTPHVGPLMILRRLAYTTGNRCIYFYYLLVVRKDWDRLCT